jgi:hypothetical protein
VPDTRTESLLVIACGALAREIIALKKAHGWGHLQLQCLDARLHNRPQLIAPLLRERIRENAGRFDRIFVAYADCGTTGAIDRVLAEEGIERLPGAHCYEFFAGSERFAQLAEQQPGTFYLTDFLARHFERLVVAPLKMDQHPQLREQYFAHYQRVVYLAQTRDSDLHQKALAVAKYLGLRFEHIDCGYGELESNLQLHIVVEQNNHGQENTHLLA